MALLVVTDDLAPDRPAPRRYAWFVFAMTFALMLVDYIDRQIVVSMFPHLKAEWDLSDKQLGALVSMVSITVALGAVPLSLIADRWSRVKSIFLMATVWSLATISCAFTRNYGQLLRAAPPSGSAKRATVRPPARCWPASFRGDCAAPCSAPFSPRPRSARCSAWCWAASSSQHWGWRAAFGVVGFPGLVLALMFLFVRDYKTVPLPTARGDGAPRPVRVRVIAAALLEPRTAVLVCLGSALQLFVLSTMYTWMPSFLNRYYGLAPDQAGLKAAIVILLGASVRWSGATWPTVPRRAAASQAVPPGRRVPADAGAHGFAFGALPPGPLQFALIAAGGLVMTCTIGPSRRW